MKIGRRLLEILGLSLAFLSSFGCASKRLKTEGLKHRACLQYEPTTKMVGACDEGDDDVPCPDWAIEIHTEKPIAPCSAEI